MDSRPCDALREIQIERLDFESSAPPQVFVSGVYDRCGVLPQGPVGYDLQTAPPESGRDVL
jgi:hypothetical protein